MRLLNHYAFAVVWRHYLVWRKLVWSSLATNVANPILFLFAFGFGLGSFIDRMDGLTYLAFIVPGMVGYGAMYAASFETTIAAYSRFAMQHTWNAVLATPVTLGELLCGEILWAASKAMLSAISVLAVGGLWGGINSWGGMLMALPIVFCASMAFAACGLLATSFARGYEFFSYFFTFWITPMFVFCGVFFEIARFPDAVQWFAWLLPMTHLIAMIRPLTAGLEVDVIAMCGHLGYTWTLTVVAFWLTHRNLSRRMFD